MNNFLQKFSEYFPEYGFYFDKATEKIQNSDTYKFFLINEKVLLLINPNSKEGHKSFSVNYKLTHTHQFIYEYVPDFFEFLEDLKYYVTSNPRLQKTDQKIKINWVEAYYPIVYPLNTDTRIETIENLTQEQIVAINIRNYSMLYRYLLPNCLELEEIFENLAFPYEAYNRRSNSDIWEVVKWFDDYVTNKIKTDYKTIYKAMLESENGKNPTDYFYNMAEILKFESAESILDPFFYSLRQEQGEKSNETIKTIEMPDESIIDSKGLKDIFLDGIKKAWNG